MSVLMNHRWMTIQVLIAYSIGLDSKFHLKVYMLCGDYLKYL